MSSWRAASEAIIMVRLRVLPLHTVLIAVVLCVGCKTSGNERPIGAVVDIKAPLGLPPVPIPADNPPTAETIALGRKLFYDTKLSKTTLCRVPRATIQVSLSPMDVRLARGVGGTRHAQCANLAECGLLAGAILGWPRAQLGGAVRLSDSQPDWR